MTNGGAVVVGAGARNGIGGALCARFAASGLHVYAVGRSADKLEPLVNGIREAGGQATAVVADATKPQDVQGLFERVAGDGRRAELVVFNASERNLPKPFLDNTPEYVEQMWRVCCFGGFLVGQA